MIVADLKRRSLAGFLRGEESESDSEAEDGAGAAQGGLGVGDDGGAYEVEDVYAGNQNLDEVRRPHHARGITLNCRGRHLENR